MCDQFIFQDTGGSFQTGNKWSEREVLHTSEITEVLGGTEQTCGGPSHTDGAVPIQAVYL